MINFIFSVDPLILHNIIELTNSFPSQQVPWSSLLDLVPSIVYLRSPQFNYYLSIHQFSSRHIFWHFYLKKLNFTVSELNERKSSTYCNKFHYRANFTYKLGNELDKIPSDLHVFAKHGTFTPNGQRARIRRSVDPHVYAPKSPSSLLIRARFDLPMALLSLRI